MSIPKLNVNVIKIGLKIAIEKEFEELLKHDYDDYGSAKIRESLDKIKQMKHELSVLEDLPCSGSVSFEPF